MQGVPGYRFDGVTDMWTCTRCLDEALVVFGSPVQQFRGFQLSEAQRQDMIDHRDYHDLQGRPPVIDGFVLDRRWRPRGVAYMYCCATCGWERGINICAFERCHTGIVRLRSALKEHRRSCVAQDIDEVPPLISVE